MGRSHPPERIEAGPVVLRRQRVEDAEAIARAVGENLEHLRPWLPWASPPAATPDAQRQRISQGVASWEAGTDHPFVITVIGEAGDQVVGMCGLHRRIGEGGIEIGYWIDGGHTGRGYATAAARALTDIALALDDVDKVEIHCDQANIPSQRVPARLGYILDRVEETPVTAPGETGRTMVWVFTAGRS